MEITTIQTNKGLYEIIDQKKVWMYLDNLRDTPIQDEIDILEYEWALNFIF
jgi:hypothetical protein